MVADAVHKVLWYLRRVAPVQDGAVPTDAQLLGRFIEQRDEAAFEALLGRHGPMVMGVCRRILHNQQDAEDAFQATFLVLVRKAACVVPRQRVANWLYGVARQTALRARASGARRRQREQQAALTPPTARTSSQESKDLQGLLDQELSRLPENYRVAIVLCDLEGMTRKEAAAQLGWPEGSLSSRLARARAMLARRLTRRGVVLGGGTLAGLLAAPAGVPAALLVGTRKAATLSAAGRTGTAGLVSAQAAALVVGVVKSMFLTKLKNVVGGLLVLGVVAGVSWFGAVLLADRLAAAQEGKRDATAAAPPATHGERRGVSPPGSPKLRATFDGEKDGTAVAISGDGKLMASESEDETVKLWDVATGREKATLKTGHDRKVLSLALGGGGRLLATGGNEGTVKLWDVATGRLKATFDGHTDQVTCVALSGDGKLLASASEDRTVKLWDVDARRQKATLEGHKGKVTSVALSGDGKLVASASIDKTVRLWEAATGRPKAVLEGHTDEVHAVALSKDGKLLVSASEDGTVLLWDVVAGRPKATLKGHADPVTAVALSGDGKLVASASDGTVKLWDAVAGREKATFEGSTHKVTSVALSGDGKLLVSGSRDGTVRLWDLP
jgi:RNA polymerase sigma factor (sigma-70 family)